MQIVENTGSQPLVSVLMTSYNRERYIAEAIESVLASTYQNFELVICDDCSTDRTPFIIESFKKKDKRIRCYRNERNLGDYPNRNHAASYARGKYLKYVDSDDRINPDALRIMVNFMESFPEAGFGLNELSNHPQESYPVLLNALEAYSFHYFKRPVFFASPGLAIFRKDAFDSVAGFPEKRMVGDFEMWHKLSLNSPLVLMPGNLYWIRKHAAQEVSQQNEFIIEYEKIKIQYLFGSRSPFSSQQAGRVIQNRKWTVLKIAFRKMLTLDLAGAALRLKVFVFYLLHFKQFRARN